MIALGASLTRTPYGQHLQGPRKNKFKIHNSVNADDINKDETAGEHTTACTEVSRDLCKSRDDASGCVFTPTALWCADIALVGDTALTISALIDEIKAQTGGKGAGDRAAVESEVAALKGLWLKEWCADHAPLCICSCILRLRTIRCDLPASRFWACEACTTAQLKIFRTRPKAEP